MPAMSVNNVDLNVIDQGQGLPVVLVHGYPLNHSMWQAQIDGLAGTCRVIAPDLRGFGASGATPGTVTMEQFADDLAGVLDALGVTVPVVLCGLSMGGYVAWQFLEKYAARLRGLVLCDTRAGADAPAAAAARGELAERVLRQGPQAAAEAMLPRLFAADTPRLRPGVVERVRQMILAADPQGIAAALRGMARRPDATPLLAQMTLPTLVLCGAEDGISPPDEMRRIAATIPGASYAEIPNAGHMAPMENPQAVTTALQAFIKPLTQ